MVRPPSFQYDRTVLRRDAGRLGSMPCHLYGSRHRQCTSDEIVPLVDTEAREGSTIRGTRIPCYVLGLGPTYMPNDLMGGKGSTRFWGDPPTLWLYPLSPIRSFGI